MKNARYIYKPDQKKPFRHGTHPSEMESGELYDRAENEHDTGDSNHALAYLNELKGRKLTRDQRKQANDKIKGIKHHIKLEG